MNFQRWCTTTLLTLATGLSACGQTISHLQDTRRQVGQPIARPSTQPGVQPEVDQWPNLEKQPMPMDRIDKPVSLDDQFQAIRAAIPEFNSVVVREAGVPKDYPTLPAMTLKNVTLGQFLQFVQGAFPAVQIIRIDGTAGALYSVRIRYDAEAMRPPTSFPQNQLHLYRLNDVIYQLAAEKVQKDKEIKLADAIKEATNDVLSLLQAALDQTDNDGPTVLKIHEPTETLMFKGSQAKQQVLEEALSTLQPRNRPNRTFFGGSGGGGSSSWNSSATSPNAEYETLLQLQNQMKALQDQAQADSDVAQKLKQASEREQQAEKSKHNGNKD